MRADRGDMLKTEDVLDILSIPLLAIIPESQEVLRASNLGCPSPLNNPLCPRRGLRRCGAPAEGEDVPMSMPTERKSFLDKLFMRRAA